MCFVNVFYDTNFTIIVLPKKSLMTVLVNVLWHPMYILIYLLFTGAPSPRRLVYTKSFFSATVARHSRLELGFLTSF